MLKNTMKLHARRNWLWLWILPAALSLALVTLARPAGGAAFWVELGIVCACSGLCGFALAVRSFSTFKERLWGGLFFAGGSLCVIGSVVFMGCFLPQHVETPAERLQREIREKARVAKLITRRDAQCDSAMLDLTSLYDVLLPGKLNKTWYYGNRVLEPGTHTWDGIKFDARGIVRPNSLPGSKTAVIPVGQKCSGMAFLDGAYYFRGRNPIGRFVVRFANGRAETIPLVYGKDVAELWFYATSPEHKLEMTNPVVWSETVFDDAAPKPYVVFYIKKWNNPLPEQTVESVVFESASGQEDPFLVAITLIPPNP